MSYNEDNIDSGVVVIGGGASGMTAAVFASESGRRVTVCEKNGALGKKILITGKGRCNLTNACDTAEMLANIPGNPSFLYSSLNGFGSASVVDFFNRMGVATKTERGRRVFPESDKSADVVSALRRKLIGNGVKINLNSPVKSLVIKDGAVSGIINSTGAFVPAGAVLIATGGLSYPATGSTGDGYTLATQAGHTIVAPRPSLVPLITAEGWVKSLEGLTLKNIGLTAYAGDGKKIIYSGFGELLFTSRGISGPLALTLSRYIPGDDPVRIHIDLKPALDEQTLDKRLQRDFSANSNKDFINAISGLLPRSLIPVIVNLSGISPHKKANEITRGERSHLLNQIKALNLTVTGNEGFNQAVITRGGVSVKEINPSNMESKLVGGLFFSGEVIDVDALTGGYNMQIAFSTGALAGRSMARVTGG